MNVIFNPCGRYTGRRLTKKLVGIDLLLINSRKYNLLTYEHVPEEEFFFRS